MFPDPFPRVGGGNDFGHVARGNDGEAVDFQNGQKYFINVFHGNLLGRHDGDLALDFVVNEKVLAGQFADEFHQNADVHIVEIKGHIFIRSAPLDRFLCALLFFTLFGGFYFFGLLQRIFRLALQSRLPLFFLPGEPSLPRRALEPELRLTVPRVALVLAPLPGNLQ